MTQNFKLTNVHKPYCGKIGKFYVNNVYEIMKLKSIVKNITYGPAP